MNPQPQPYSPLKGELWFVYDREIGFETYKTEAEAETTYLKNIQVYREAAEGGEWEDEVEDISWGKVFQTTELISIKCPEDMDPEYFYRDFDDIYGAFPIERRPEVK